jgi:hypothetical protein
MDLATDMGLVQIHTNIARAGNRVVLAYAIETDSQQTVPRKEPRLLARRVTLYGLSNYTLLGVDPFDAIPGRCFVTHALAKIE